MNLFMSILIFFLSLFLCLFSLFLEFVSLEGKRGLEEGRSLYTYVTRHFCAEGKRGLEEGRSLYTYAGNSALCADTTHEQKG